jgi:uncharacterized integral membrane protein
MDCRMSKRGDMNWWYIVGFILLLIAMVFIMMGIAKSGSFLQGALGWLEGII